MDLRSLRYFVVLSKCLSYARAAEELGITQSALSRSIQVIEAEFSFRLFDRSRAGVSLTSAGREIVDHATALLVSAVDLDRHMRETSAGKSGRLQFGIAPVPARALLRESLADRLEAAPQINIKAVVRPMDVLRSMLISGELDFVVGPASQMTDMPYIRKERLGNFPVSLIVRPGHPALDKVNPFNPFPILLSSEGSLVSGYPEGFFEGARTAAHVIEDFDGLIGLTKASNGIWMTSPYAVIKEVISGELVELSLQPNSTRRSFDVSFFTLKQRALPRIVDKMKESLKNTFTRVSKLI